MNQTQWFDTLRTQLQRARHRQLIVLCGDLSWRLQQLEQFNLANNRLWIGETSLITSFQHANLTQLQHQLGQEVAHAILCAETGIDADAFGLVSGMIQAGGNLWLLIPPLEDWLQLPNPANQRFMSFAFNVDQAETAFITHLYQTLHQHGYWIKQNRPLPGLVVNTPNQTAIHEGLTADQQRGLVAISQVANGHTKRPLVISADRGRGKTTLLGAAAAQFLQQGKTDIVLSAARLGQCELAFNYAAQLLDVSPQAPGLVVTENQQTLRFKAPDDLLLNPCRADLILIDEAAQLPTPMLQAILARYPRVVFATTLHGYEGSGRGFSLRLLPIMDKLYPGWQQLHLQQPVRWAEHDPLELATNQALLLDCELPMFDVMPPLAKLAFETLKPSQLSPTDLKQVFALLVHAHYQTRPADLQQLLSANDLTLYIARIERYIVGVLLVLTEGNLPPLGNERRVKGHLVPQLLRQHSGVDSLLTLNSERVMRLAVHPQIRRQRIASQLIQAWRQHSPADFFSASFGVTDDLLQFWQRQGFYAVHLGAKRDKASGSYNLIMLHSTNPISALQQVKNHYQHQLVHNLMENANRLAPGLVLQLLAEIAPPKTQDTPVQAALLAYANQYRPFEAISGLLWQWTLNHPQQLMCLGENEQALWLDKILKKQDWQTVALHHGLAGRKGVETRLKQIINQLNTLINHKV